jgi:23S rRNA (adenine2503-C2)-methyltransferase
MGAGEKHPLSAYSLESLSNVVAAAGFPRYRAKQILKWMYARGARSFDQMKNIGTPLRGYLTENLTPMSSQLAAVHDAGDGAGKLEIRLQDAVTIESVLIDAEKRLTLCVSCQAGCPLGCAFCATGAGGFQRDLLPHEIVEQALHAATAAGERRISHVVFMGMGEPCLNLDAVFDAARILNAPYAFGIAARRITISTLGFPKCIDRIAEFPLEVGLAISLHAATDDARAKLCPSAPGSIAEMVRAAQDYFTKTGREVTYEYVLLSGVNDSLADAAALGRLLTGKRAYVNLIPYNEVRGLPFRRPPASKVIAFRRALETEGINVHVRDSRGQGANAACGQLRFERGDAPG